jgi:hypothetical protein
MATKITIRAVGESIFLIAAVATIFAYIDEHAALTATREALSKAQKENAALFRKSLPGFLESYKRVITALKNASDAYEKAKGVKGADIPDSDAWRALKDAENELYRATDNFTDVVNRWRIAAKLLDKLIDGNVTELENSRSQENADAVHNMADRIVKAAPDLAAQLGMALDAL